MTAELSVLADAVGRLERAGLRYMLTGSMALAHYAQPRMTRDIDLVVELSEPDAEFVAGLLSPDYYVAAEDILRAIRSRGMFNVLHLGQMVKLDLIVRKDDEYRATEFARRERADLGGVMAWIVSKEDLVLSKLVWAKPSRSEIQLRDVRLLLATGADEAYLRRWASYLNVNDLLDECLDARHDS